MAEHPSRIDYVVQLEARLARLSDWAALADENDALRADLADVETVLQVLSGNSLIYQQLRARRADMGLSQRTLAAAAGVRQATVWRVESGAPKVFAASVEAMAAAMGCRVLLIPREVGS